MLKHENFNIKAKELEIAKKTKCQINFKMGSMETCQNLSKTILKLTAFVDVKKGAFTCDNVYA